MEVWKVLDNMEKDFRTARDNVRKAAAEENDAALYNAVGECLWVLSWQEAGTVIEHCIIGGNAEDTIECICRRAAKMCGLQAAGRELINLRRWFTDLLPSLDRNILMDLSDHGFEAALAVRDALHRMFIDRDALPYRDYSRLYDKISEFIQRGIYA